MSVREPRWVPRLVIEAMHLDQLREHGGVLGLSDEAALDAALAGAKQRFADEPGVDLAALAAAYAVELAINAPFRDGNRRIAFLAAAIFLGLNGQRLAAPAAEIVAQMRALTCGDLGAKAAADWIRSRAVAVPGNPARPRR